MADEGPGTCDNKTTWLAKECYKEWAVRLPPPSLLLRYPTEKKKARKTDGRKKNDKKKQTNKQTNKQGRKEKKERKAEIQKNRKKEILKENREKLSNKLNILGWEIYRKTNR